MQVRYLEYTCLAKKGNYREESLEDQQVYNRQMHTLADGKRAHLQA